MPFAPFINVVAVQRYFSLIFYYSLLLLWQSKMNAKTIAHTKKNILPIGLP
jgi:hypothetical protein